MHPAALGYLQLAVRRNHVLEDVLNQVRRAALLMYIPWLSDAAAPHPVPSNRNQPRSLLACLQLAHRGQELKKPLRVTFYSGGVAEPAQARQPALSHCTRDLYCTC